MTGIGQAQFFHEVSFRLAQYAFVNAAFLRSKRFELLDQAIVNIINGKPGY